MNSKDPELPSQSFCILPWHNLFVSTSGYVYPCCIAEGAKETFHSDSSTLNDLGAKALADTWNGETMRELRRDMLAGKWSKSCKRCQIQERFQNQSMRLASNRRLARKIPSAIEKTDARGVHSDIPQSLDIRLGNNCNLRCRMCSPDASAKLLEFFGGEKYWEKNPLRFEWAKDEAILNDLLSWAPQLETLNFAGGEPLASKAIIRFLESIVERDWAHSIRLTFNTNATILNESLFGLLHHFKSVEFFLSIDGPSEINSYVRSPAKWTDIQSFLARAQVAKRTAKLEVQVAPTAQAINIGFLPEMVDYFWTHHADTIDYIGNGLVSGHEHMMATVLPSPHKKWVTNNFNLLRQKWERSPTRPKHCSAMLRRFDGLVDYMNSEDRSDLWETLVAEMHRYDETYAAKMPQSLKDFLNGNFVTSEVLRNSRVLEEISP